MMALHKKSIYINDNLKKGYNFKITQFLGRSDVMLPLNAGQSEKYTMYNLLCKSLKYFNSGTDLSIKTSIHLLSAQKRLFTSANPTFFQINRVNCFYYIDLYESYGIE